MRLMHQLTLFPALPQDSILAKSRMPLQRHNTENVIQIFPEKEFHGLRPNFHIHVSVSDLYIPTIDRSDYSAAGKYVDRPWEYINRSQTHECGVWD
jgi:hypothetical protein